MNVDLSVTGADHLAAVGADLRRVADKDLTKKFQKAMQHAAAPLRDEAAAAALYVLPKRGGLAELIGDRKNFTAKVRTRGPRTGVRVESKKNHDVASLERGRIRHLTFGRPPWVSQPTDRNWFTTAETRKAQTVRPELEKAMDEIKTELAGRG